MDRVLEILHAHCDHWRSVIPMMETGKITMREDGRDTTDETILECKRLLSETMSLIEKIQADLT